MHAFDRIEHIANTLLEVAVEELDGANDFFSSQSTADKGLSSPFDLFYYINDEQAGGHHNCVEHIVIRSALSK